MWCYKILVASGGTCKFTEKTLNSLGSKGWELVSVSSEQFHTFLYLKRTKDIQSVFNYRKSQLKKYKPTPCPSNQPHP